MRKPILAGNWKMNKTIPEAVALAKELAAIQIPAGREVLVCPSAICLAPVAEALKGSAIKLGAQNIHFEAKGAFTGENAADMVKSAGASHTLLGHSERRSLFGETDEIINRKMKHGLANGLVTVLCVGEVLAERESGRQNDVVSTQIKGGLAGIAASQLASVVIAYEPVWAIGTGKTASPEDADAMHKHIRALIAQLYTQADADAMRILYGGSVTDANVDALMGKEHVDGALVGGASLKADSFKRIIQFV